MLFDAVGTLIHPHPPAVDIYFDAGRRFGSRLTRETVAQRFRDAFRVQEQLDMVNSGTATAVRFERHPTDEFRERRRWTQIVEFVFEDVPSAGEGLFETLWRHFADSKSWQVYEDVAKGWRKLERLGYLLGIASNFDQRLFTISKSLDPLLTCENVFCSSRIGYPKPSPRFFRAVEQTLGLPPRAILMVGDNWHCDIEGARAAGWQTVHLDRSLAESSAESIFSLTDLMDRLPDPRI